MAARKRVTEKQLAANRANAKRSSGPRTLEGKAKSRWNAMRHGILAQAVIPPALEPVESRTAFDDLLASLRAECAPATVAEGALVEMIAVTYWRLGRLLRTEAAAMVAANRPPRNDSPEDAQAVSRLQASADRLTNALDDPAALRKIMDPTGAYADLSDYRIRDLALQRRAIPRGHCAAGVAPNPVEPDSFVPLVFSVVDAFRACRIPALPAHPKPRLRGWR